MPDFEDKARFPGVTALRDSGQALLVLVAGRERWVPQSQIDDDSEVYERGDSGVLVISQWWAEKEKWV